MAKKQKARYEPWWRRDIERDIKGPGFLEILTRAGPNIVDGFLAVIDARAAACGNELFAHAIKSAAREILAAATSPEGRARALDKCLSLTHLAAFQLGRQDRKDESGQGARDQKRKKKDARDLLLDDAIAAERKKGTKLGRSNTCAKFIRPSVLEFLGVEPEKEGERQKWPSVSNDKKQYSCSAGEGVMAKTTRPVTKHPWEMDPDEALAYVRDAIEKLAAIDWSGPRPGGVHDDIADRQDQWIDEAFRHAAAYGGVIHDEVLV